MENCIFCKIAAGEIPSDKVYEDDLIFAFRDISPQAPTHILIIPKTHIESADKLESAHKELIAHILLTAGEIARKEGVDKTGYRILTNCGKDAGQTVFHLHFHLLAGAPMENLV